MDTQVLERNEVQVEAVLDELSNQHDAGITAVGDMRESENVPEKCKGSIQQVPTPTNQQIMDRAVCFETNAARSILLDGISKKPCKNTTSRSC